MRNFLLLLASFALFCEIALAQNWAARMYSTSPATDPFIIAGGPTNWIAEWRDLGTNLVPPALFTFVGNDSAKAAFISARLPAWQNWKTNVFDLQDSFERSNLTFSVINNISDLAQLFAANQAFLDAVNAGQNIGPVVLSNQTVRSARILKRLEPLLRSQYNGQ